MEKLGKIFLLLLLVVSCKETTTGDSVEEFSFNGVTTAQALSSNSIQIGWSPAAGSDVSGYQIFSMADDTSLTSIGLVGVNESFYVHKSLSSLTKYRYVVRAIRSYSDQDQNNVFVEATTLAPGDLNLSPKTVITTTYKTHGFVTTDGRAPYTYSIVSGAGIINASTGEFISPSSPGYTVIKVTDSNASYAFAEISTYAPMSIEPNTTQLKFGRKMKLNIIGGTGPYQLSITSGSNYGVLDATLKTFQAGALEGVVNLKLVDANGLQTTALINVVSEYAPKVLLGAAREGACTAIENESFAYCWGRNIGPYLGTGNSSIGDEDDEMGDNLKTSFVGESTNFQDVAIGSGMSCYHGSDSQIRCIGTSGSAGRLGNSSTTADRDNLSKAGNLTPIVSLGTGRSVKKMSLGNSFNCAILDNDKLKCWGHGYRGRTGNGDSQDRGNESGEMGDSLPYVDLGTGRTIKQIVSSSISNCAILDNDKVKCFGDASYGNLGNASTTSHFGDAAGEMGDALPYVDLGTGRTAKSIAAGTTHYCVVLDNNRLKCWGRNSGAQLGLEDSNDRGDNVGEMGDSLPYVNVGTGRTVLQVAAGESGTCALLDNYKLKCWGSGTSGIPGQGNGNIVGNAAGEMGDSLNYLDLGVGATVSAVYGGFASNTMCAILGDLQTKCWGGNTYGQLGLGHTNTIGDSVGEMGDNLPPVELGSGLYATKISISNASVCALLNDSSAKCWGSNSSSQVSIHLAVIGDEAGEMWPNLRPSYVGFGIKSIVEGSSYGQTILTTNSQIRAWGSGSNGRLGKENTSAIGNFSNEMGGSMSDIDLGTGLSVVQSTTGSEFKCALLDNEQIKCWGRNDYGQLGQGHASDLGDSVGEMGDNLPFIDLGTGRSVKKLVSGSNHSCALLDNAKVKCWGYNTTNGRLGLGDTSTRGNEPGEMGDNLPYVDVGTGRSVRDIFANYENVCVVLDNYGVKCWGRNDYGQLGQGHTSVLGDEPGEMGDNLPALDLGTSEVVVKIAISARAMCAHFVNEEVKCWGNNYNGQLGRGDNSNIGDNPAEMGSKLKVVNVGNFRRIVDVVALEESFCAILDNSDIKCWGDNTYGQLGIESSGNKGLVSSDMGNNLKVVKIKAP